MNDETTILDELPDLDDAPFEEIEPVLSVLAGDLSPEDPGFLNLAREVRGLLLDRALNLLRTGSRTEINAEAYAFHRFLESAAGKGLLDKAPGVHGGFLAIADLLSGAGDRADFAAVDSILRSHKGRGQAILELLAQRGEAVKRSIIRGQLAVSESHLSHILREMEEADLLVRYRRTQGREVLVELAPTGREYVERSVLPEWIRYLEQHLDALVEGKVESWDVKAVAKTLVESGAPSEIAAARLSASLGKLVAWAGPSASRQPSHTSDRHLEAIQDRQNSRAPAALLTVH
jgi:DNA-binding MarR family transcriptional regulator